MYVCMYSTQVKKKLTYVVRLFNSYGYGRAKTVHTGVTGLSVATYVRTEQAMGELDLFELQVH